MRGCSGARLFSLLDLYSARLVLPFLDLLAGELLDTKESHPFPGLADLHLQGAVVLSRPLDVVVSLGSLLTVALLPPLPASSKLQHGARVAVTSEQDQGRIVRQSSMDAAETLIETFQSSSDFLLRSIAVVVLAILRVPYGC